MKMKHTVKLRSGEYHIYFFKSKQESDKALANAICINKTFNTIEHICIEMVGWLKRKVKIDFDERGYRI